MLRWGLLGLVLVVAASACGAEVALESSAPTLPPLQLPAVLPTVPNSGGTVTTLAPDPGIVDLPAILTKGSFDVFAQLDVAQYQVTFREVGARSDQEAVYMYQRDPQAGRIVGIADGDEVEVVVIGDLVWARFGPTPDGALVEASETLAVLAGGFFEPGAVAAQNMDPLDFNVADFTLAGPGEFDGRPAYEYTAPAPRQFSWWVDADGVIVGGGGTIGFGEESSEVSFTYRWDEASDLIEVPTNTITADEYFAFLNGENPSDPTGLQAELRSVQVTLERSRAEDGVFGTDQLDAMVAQGLIDGWQLGISTLSPGVIGLVLESDSALLAGGMPDGRHYCIAILGEAVSYGASYTLAELAALDGCSVPDDFPDLAPPA